MRNRTALARPLILFATFSLCCRAQAPSSAAQAPRAASAGVPTTPPAPAGSVATIQTNARLVVVDVVVTDRSGKPVHGLDAANFTLTENGASQTVKNFEEHTALSAADVAHLKPMPVLPPGIFTNYTPAPANGAVNIVLLDTLNTPLKDQTYVRQQLLAYLKSIPLGTRVAIFGLTDRLLLLQGFTSDPEVLRSILDKDRGKGSPLLDDQVGGGGIQNSMADTMEDQSDADGTSALEADVIANVRQFEAEQQSFQQQLRVKFTLDGFNQLARYLSNIPGRKNLVWFSGSFPINILPDTSGTLNNPFAVAASFEDEFRQTTDLLGRSQVAVYPVDARGLTTSPVFDVTTTRNYSGPHGNQRMMQDQTKFFTDTANEHTTMNAMADATGGHAFFNTNDLTRAVSEAIDQGSNFYSLTYTPANPALDGKLRKIKVQSVRTGLTLSYRQGYYADPPEKITTNATVSASMMHDQAVTTTNGLSPQDTLRLAMTRGAPTPSDILMRVGVLPITPAASPEEAPARGNSPSPKAHGPWRRYAVNYQVDPKDIVFFRGPDGKIHADFDVIIFVYTADGAALNALSTRVGIADSIENVRQLVKQGIIGHEEISAPAKGESFLRIAVHDLHRDHYGAVEVATSQVKNVVPIQPPPAAGAATGK